MRFIFRPVAQNTIIRPMAQAVCLMHGGKETKYVDPTDGKEKVITSFDVSYLRLETMVKGRKFLMDGNQVAFHAEHYPQKASIRTEINDVDVYIVSEYNSCISYGTISSENQPKKQSSCFACFSST